MRPTLSLSFVILLSTSTVLSASPNLPSLHGPPALNAASQGKPNEHNVTGIQAAVATEVDFCSNVGADLLAKGGSAADAVSLFSTR